MGKDIVVIILGLFLSALLRLESKLIVAACSDASVKRGIFRVRNVRTRKIRNSVTFFIYAWGPWGSDMPLEGIWEHGGHWRALGCIRGAAVIFL
jgi:hypothetical protein